MHAYAAEKKLVSAHVLVAVVALTLGTLFGPLQALEHMGFNLYQPLVKVGLQSYYQGLTLHGVLNALVFTTFFITGFLTLAVVRGLEKPLTMPWLSWTGFWLMVVGLVMAAIPLLLNLASVLYTFYPPMQAPWYYYVGLTLVVVGSWVSGWSQIATFLAWKKEHPGQKTPLITLGALINTVLWQVATLGIAAEILLLILPWCFGWVKGIDPQLARTLFWFTGHPLVYFWLLPAYLSWYGMLPKQAGGKLFSEPMARLAFWMFLLLSTPLGFHHQFVDPGVPAGWKLVHAMLTLGVFFPSLLTAFNVIASLEIGGRARGGKGLLGWVPRLPWGDPSFAAQACAMLLFAFGGMSGLINASYNLNMVVHNTAWVPGHLHLTVGSAATLSFLGIMYWLIPYLTGRALWGRKVALAQAWTWLVGMLIFSRGMHWIGLLGAPRRTMLGVAAENYGNASWNIPRYMTGIGGMILLVSFLLFLLVAVMTAFFSKERVELDVPLAEPAAAEPIPLWLNNWTPWLAGMVALIVVAYGPMLFNLISNMQATSPGFEVWKGS